MKLIPLTKGYFAKVDDQDYERLSKFKWHFNRGYASRTTPGPHISRKHIPMQNEVMHAADDIWLDHKNRDRLDNQKDNLRTSDPTTNHRNTGRCKNNKSGFKGVFWNKGKWIASIQDRYNKIYLGRFSTAEEAARVYDAKAIELFGEFAFTNFEEVQNA